MSCWLTIGWMAYMVSGSFVVVVGRGGLGVTTDWCGGWFSSGLTGPTSSLGVTCVTELPTDGRLAVLDEHAQHGRMLVHGVSFRDGVGGSPAAEAVGWCK